MDENFAGESSGGAGRDASAVKSSWAVIAISRRGRGAPPVVDGAR